MLDVTTGRKAKKMLPNRSPRVALQKTHLRRTARTGWRFSQVEAEEMIGLRAILSVTHNQLSSLSTAIAEILVGLFALSLQFTLLGFEFGIAHLLLPLHHHCTLQKDK